MRSDVAVVGGGSAGIAAAVTAARSGARVVLIEKNARLGGQASGALVHTICGLYLLREHESQPLQPANPGFPMEFAQHLLRIGGASGPIRMGRLDVLLHEPAAFATLAENLCAALPGLEVRLQTRVLKAEPEADRMALCLDSLGQREELETGTVVDTTGGAEVAALAGAGWTQADQLQKPAYIFKMTGVDSQAMTADGRIRTAQALSGAVADRILPPAVLLTTFRTGVTAGEVWATVDLAGDAADPFDPIWLARIESEGRESAEQIARFLRDALPGFRQAAISALPECAGIRESRRIQGQYELSTEDIRTGALFPDAVAWSAWPMEFHDHRHGTKFHFPLDNRPCSIPMRSLRSRDFDNLFMAGRCISCSHEAQAAVRVIGTCMATGEAAGKAAAGKAVDAPRVDP